MSLPRPSQPLLMSLLNPPADVFPAAVAMGVHNTASLVEKVLFIQLFKMSYDQMKTNHIKKTNGLYRLILFISLHKIQPKFFIELSCYIPIPSICIFYNHLRKRCYSFYTFKSKFNKSRNSINSKGTLQFQSVALTLRVVYQMIIC